MISVVVVNYNDAKTVVNYINVIQHYRAINHIAIVDNCSTDDSLSIMRILKNDKVDVIKSDRNGGYGYGNNYGMRYLHKHYNSDLILISNADVMYDEVVLDELEQKMRTDNTIAVVAPIMRLPNGDIEMNSAWDLSGGWGYVLKNSLPFSMLYKKNFPIDTFSTERQVGAVAGSMLLVRYNDMLNVGFYDEDVFLYCEETILGLKLKQLGKKTVVLNNVNFTHYHSVSIKKSIKTSKARKKVMWKSRKHVLKKYYGFGAIKLAFVDVIRIVDMFFT